MTISTSTANRTSEIEVKEVPAQRVAAVRVEASQQDVFAAIPEGMGQILASLGQHGTGPIGAPFVMFHAFPSENTKADLSVCVPTDLQVAPQAAGVELVDMPASVVASLVHVGPYEKLQESYEVVGEWMRANEHQVSGASREVYLTSPGEVDDAEMLTEIQFPIAGTL